MSNEVDFNAIAIDGVDTKQGTARFGNKAERYFKSLRKFSKSLPEQVLPFEDFATEGGSPEAGTILHTIKGVAGNLGMMKLFDAIVAFEDSIRKNAPNRELYEVVSAQCHKIAADVLEKTDGLDLE